MLVCSGNSSAALIEVLTLVDSPELDPGDVVGVELVVSDFKPEPVAAFDLSLLFDENVLQVESVTLGSFLGDAAFFETIESIDTSSSGVVSISSLSILEDAVLATLQPTRFTLASVDFLAIGPGASGFALDTSAPFSGIVGSFGTELATTFGAVPDVTVRPAFAEVSEPHALGLMAIGLMAWCGSRGRARGQSGGPAAGSGSVGGAPAG